MLCNMFSESDAFRMFYGGRIFGYLWRFTAVLRLDGVGRFCSDLRLN